MAENPLHNLPYQVTAAIQQGNLVQAIKALRQHKPNLGLAEAKALIEALQAQSKQPGSVKAGVKAEVKSEAKTAAKAIAAKAMTPHVHAPSHIPPPEGMPPPGSNLSMGEVPRTASAPAFLLLIVAIAVVAWAAIYFGR